MSYEMHGKIIVKRSNSKKLFQVPFFLWFLTISHLSIAQNTNKVSLISIFDVENYIANNYHPDSSKITNVCQNSCVFIRFEISPEREIINIDFNKNIPDFITDELMNVFVKMGKNAAFSDTLVSAHKIYLLPFIYNYQSGCRTFYNKDKLSTYKKDLAGNIVYDEQQGNAIINMLNFRQKKLAFLDCVLLPPIRTGNMSETGF
jgi:hypothetical protein